MILGEQFKQAQSHCHIFRECGEWKFDETYRKSFLKNNPILTEIILMQTFSEEFKPMAVEKLAWKLIK